MNRSTIWISILLIYISNNVFGTAQIPDYLIYKKDTLSIYSNPLETYFENHTRPNSIFAEMGYNSTACWRGYVAYWELKNDSLYLVEIQGGTTKIDFSLISEEWKGKDKIFANWVNYSITNPYGNIIHYEHMGYESIYEYEKEFIFQNGLLIQILNYDNSKSQKSKYTQNPELLKAYIQNTIDYTKITHSPHKKALVIVQIISVTETGKIDSLKIARGHDTERDLEALRVVKSIPEWDILYKRGKQINPVWTIPVTFSPEE